MVGISGDEAIVVLVIFLLGIVGFLADVWYAVGYAVDIFNTSHATIEGVFTIVSVFIPILGSLTGWYHLIF